MRFRVTVMIVSAEESEPHKFHLDAETHAEALIRTLEETCGEPLEPTQTLAIYAEALIGEELQNQSQRRTEREFAWSLRNLSIGTDGRPMPGQERTAEDDELGLPPDRTTTYRVENLVLRGDPNDYGPVPDVSSNLIAYDPFPRQRAFHVGHAEPPTPDELLLARAWAASPKGQTAILAAHEQREKKNGSQPPPSQAHEDTGLTSEEIANGTGRGSHAEPDPQQNTGVTSDAERPHHPDEPK